jgi:molybdenum cofactor cytidylyltransferase
MGATLATGVAATAEAAGWVIALADMPWIAPATVATIATRIAAGAAICAPVRAGRRGHPVGFDRRYRDALMRLTGDQGARSVIAAHRDALLEIAVDDPGILRDVDRPEDLA